MEIFIGITAMNILITGGLGFIGLHTAKYFAELGDSVYILDNLSRKGNIHNYNLLKKYKNINFLIKDIKNYFDLENIFTKNKFDIIIHLAAQVAVTTSVSNPREDFEINCLGTFNILECCRLYNPNAIILYSSTNKVYGSFNIKLQEDHTRYIPTSFLFKGVDEKQQLDFHSPYGCSKGCGDQYVIDYSRIYGLKTVVLRQSCIYGPNQFGIEDQGWVSWFSIAATHDASITIYGDGKQVRDVLYIDDLINLYHQIINNINQCNGQAYNVGGGLEYTISLLELVSLLENKLNIKINYSLCDWRPGDQKIYISNISKIYEHIGWKPRQSIDKGIDTMLSWIKDNKTIFQELKLI